MYIYIYIYIPQQDPPMFHQLKGLQDPSVVGIHQPGRGLPELVQLRLEDLSDDA